MALPSRPRRYLRVVSAPTSVPSALNLFLLSAFFLFSLLPYFLTSLLLPSPNYHSPMHDSNSPALAFLRIVVRLFFLLSPLSKIFGTQFTLHRRFPVWIY